MDCYWYVCALCFIGEKAFPECSVDHRPFPHRPTYWQNLLESSSERNHGTALGTSHSQRGLGKKLKRYWKLLQKEEAKLNYEKRVWRASFKDYLTESEIVDRLLSACPNLRQGYQLYQDILYAVKKRDQSLFEDCLNREVSGLPETYTTTLRTFKKFLPQIQNALHYSYSNGPLECLNNHIKVLKRNAYGFRSFYNFKLRIMIRHGKTFLTK